VMKLTQIPTVLSKSSLSKLAIFSKSLKSLNFSIRISSLLIHWDYVN